MNQQKIEKYIRVAKERALININSILSSQGTEYENYNYATLRQMYSLSEFLIRTSNSPEWLLNEGYKLDLISDFEWKEATC